MDGQHLIDALVLTTGERLRLVYALLGETGWFHILSEKVREVFSRDSNHHFYEKLRSQVEAHSTETDAAMQLRLLLQITELLGLSGLLYNSRQGLANQGERIVSAVAELVRKHDEQFAGHTLHELVQHQKAKVFEQLDKQFTSLPEEKQEVYFAHIRSMIAHLPPERQAEVQERVGDRDCTSEGLRRVLTEGGTRLLFNAHVDTAVIASPFFLTGLVAGKGLLFYRSQNRKLQEKLLPLVLTLLVQSAAGETVADCDPLIAEWDGIYQPYAENLLSMQQDEAEILQTEAEINHCLSTVRRLTNLRNDVLERQRSLVLQIKNKLVQSEVTMLHLSTSFDALANEYVSRSLMIQALKVNKSHKAGSPGLKGWINQKMEHWEISRKIQKLEKEQEEALDAMVHEVRQDDGQFCREERESLRMISEQAEQLDTELDAWEAKLSDQRSKLSHLQERASRRLDTKKSMEKQHYGLEHLA